MMVERKVEQFFDKDARSFDSIYAGNTSRLMRWLNRRFRKGVYLRHEEALGTCGEVACKQILDVGCGSGRMAVALAIRGAQVVGLDFSDRMLRMAHQLAEQRGVAERCSFVRKDFLQYEPERRFDIVLALGFFDYVRDAYPFLRRMHDCTTRMVIATFPRLWTLRTPLRKLRLWLLGCPVYFYTEPQIIELCSRSDLEVKRIEPQANAYFLEAQAKSC